MNGPRSMIARTSSGDFFRAAAIRPTRLPYRSSTMLVMTSRVSGLMSVRVNMSPKSLYFPACSTSTSHAQLVQRVLEIHHLGAHALEHERLLRPEINAVGAQRDVIFTRAGLPEKCIDGLAGLAELLDVRADFFELRPTRRDTRRLQNDALDIRIDGRLLETHPDAGNGDAGVTVEEIGQFDPRLFRNFAVQPHQQHRIGRNLRAASRENEEARQRAE